MEGGGWREYFVLVWQEIGCAELSDVRVPAGFGGGGKNNHFTEMCSGSEAGSYLRLIDFVYH